MKPVLRHILYWGAIAVAVLVYVIATTSGKSVRHATSCHGVEVTILDSAARRFVSVDDVKEYLKGYGLYVGQRIDSVDLARMEVILDSKSAILNSDAYITDDGTLHIEVTQREPVVRFQKGDIGFYADRSGYIFPLHRDFAANVPIVSGDIPLWIKKGFKGEPESKSEILWLQRIIGLVGFMDASGIWAANISEIYVDKGHNLVLVPRVGQERFIFGEPTRIKEKFALITRYYDTIAPAAEGKYKSVDVRFDSQIVCKK